MDIQETLQEIAKTFDEFRSANDERIKQIESKGAADPLLEEKVDKLSLALKDLEDTRKRLDKVELRQSRPNVGDYNESDTLRAEHRKAFDRFIRKGEESGLRDIETRALNITNGSDGGYLVPEVTDPNVVNQFLKVSPMRQIATVRTIGSSDYRILVNTRGTASGWVGETAARPETATPSIAEVQAVMGEVYANAYATQHLLDDAYFDAEAFLVQNLYDEFAQEEGAAFVSGNGTNKPKGFLGYTLSTSVDGSRTFGQLQYKYTGTSGAFKTTSATVNPIDDFVDLLHALKPEFRANATWVMNALTLAAVRKFKDADGGPVWQPATMAGNPATILGYPVVEMPDMPDIGANSLSVAVGDFRSGYTIIDRVGVRVLRDPYTAKPHVAFYATKRVGGMVTDSDAIKILKLGGS